MTPKRYLSQYRKANREIIYAQDQLEDARRIAAGLRAIIYTDMPRAQDTERDLSDAMVKVEELEREYAATLKRCLGIRVAIEGAVSSVPNPLYKYILIQRYIAGKKPEPWEEIAEDLGKSTRWVYVLHGRALESVKSFLGTSL